ncbi:MAG: Protein mazG, partial [candidate division NC10 bacterium]|nr:Protein mazG [candidate division NC10 bacterium]
WPEISGVIAKVQEELDELNAAMQGAAPNEIELELGDLLFSLVNMARFLNLSAEDALRKSIGRFSARFRYMEQTIERGGRRLKEASPEEMNSLWEEAKASGRLPLA